MDSGGLTVVITSRLIHWLLSRRQEQAPRDAATGRFLLSYCGPYRATVIACTLIFAGFLSLGIVLRDEPVSWAVYSSIFGLATFGSCFWLHQVFLVRTSFSEEGIHREGGLGSSEILPWSSVTRVDYSESTSSFRFRGADGQKIGVSIFQNGLGTFVEFASRRMANGPAAGVLPLLHQKALNP